MERDDETFFANPFGSHFSSFEDFGYLGRATTESTAGIGLGICLLVFISVLAVKLRKNFPRDTPIRQNSFLNLLRWTPFLALLIFMAKVGSHSNARQLGPYYVFFFPLLLTSAGHAHLTRRRWWQSLGLAVMVFTTILLIISRSSPLFPVQSIIARLKATDPQSSFLSKIEDSYSYWNSMRTAVVNPLKREIPPDEHTVGYATFFGYCEPGLWLPFGGRNVERILPNDTAEDLHHRKIRYVVIGSEFFELAKEKTIKEWLNNYNGELIDQMSYSYSPGGLVLQLYLVHLR